MRLSISMSLKDYYHKYDIGNLFHDHDHVHVYETILCSLQGMTQIQLDEIWDSLLVTHYFIQ